MNDRLLEKKEIEKKYKRMWLLYFALSLCIWLVFIVLLLIKNQPLPLRHSIIILLVLIHFGITFIAQIRTRIFGNKVQRKKQNNIEFNNEKPLMEYHSIRRLADERIYFFITVSLTILLAIALSFSSRSTTCSVPIQETLKFDSFPLVQAIEKNSEEISRNISELRTSVEKIANINRRSNSIGSSRKRCVSIVLILICGVFTLFAGIALFKFGKFPPWFTIASIISIGGLTLLNLDSLTLYSKQINLNQGGFGYLNDAKKIGKIYPFPDGGEEISDPSANGTLNDVVDRLSTIPKENVGFVFVIGHTDLRPLSLSNEKKYESNTNLAYARARHIADKLAARTALPRNKIIEFPSGATYIGDEYYIKGHPEDRCVEVYIIYKQNSARHGGQ